MGRKASFEDINLHSRRGWWFMLLIVDLTVKNERAGKSRVM